MVLSPRYSELILTYSRNGLIDFSLFNFINVNIFSSSSICLIYCLLQVRFIIYSHFVAVVLSCCCFCCYVFVVSLTIQMLMMTLFVSQIYKIYFSLSLSSTLSSSCSSPLAQVCALVVRLELLVCVFAFSKHCMKS